MVRKGQKIYEDALRFISENRRTTYGKIQKHLDSDESVIDSVLSELCGKDNNSYIKVINLPHKSKSDHTYEITLKGIEYLNHLDLHKLQRSQTRFSKYLLIATTVLALQVLIGQFDKLTNAYLIWGQDKNALFSAYSGFAVIIFMTFLIGFLILSMFRGGVFSKDD